MMHLVKKAVILFFFFFFKILFLERGEGRERGQKHQFIHVCERCIDQLLLIRPQMRTWPTTQACALIGNQTSDLLVCRPALKPLSHTSQGSFIFMEHLLFYAKH